MFCCFRRRMPAVWECSHERQFREEFIPNHFDYRLWLRHSRMTKTDAVQQNSLVQVCHPIAQIHITFLMHMKKCILQMCFHLVFAHVFLSDKKIMSNSVERSSFLCTFLEFIRILWCFHSVFFFYAIFQNMHKNRWMETAINSCFTCFRYKLIKNKCLTN